MPQTTMLPWNFKMPRIIKLSWKFKMPQTFMLPRNFNLPLNINLSWNFSLLWLLLACPLAVMAQGSEGETTGRSSLPARSDVTTTKTFLFGAGATNLLDTYLSPEKYRGTDYRLSSLSERRRDTSRVSFMQMVNVSLQTADNRSSNGNLLGGLASYAFGWHYHLQLFGERVELQVGALADLSLGFVYSTRNGNNPAQLRAAADVRPSVAATCPFRLWRVPLSARLQADAPLCGLMFSPRYGQSYYEIFYRNDYDRNLVPTTFVSTPSVRYTLSLDFPLLGTTWRVGYMGDIRQSHVNDIKTHTWTHAAVVGFVWRVRNLP